MLSAKNWQILSRNVSKKAGYLLQQFRDLKMSQTDACNLIIVMIDYRAHYNHFRGKTHAARTLSKTLNWTASSSC